MDYVQRLQILDNEKFVELCLMHITIVLDLHDDEFAALLDSKGEKKKNRSYFSRLVKEKAPEEPMALNQETISHVYQIIEFLGRDTNICVEGVFFKTGSIVRQNKLKTQLRRGENIDFSSDSYTVHDCACVLKSFLADLSEPLLSEAHYSAHCQISDMSRKGLSKEVVLERQLKATRLLFLLLPPDNYCMLKYLLLLLYQVQNCSRESNEMGSHSLATLFAPHIMCPRKMSPEALKENYPCLVKSVTFLIEKAPLLFEPPEELVEDIKMHFKGMTFEGQIQDVHKEDEAVRSLIAFCDRPERSATQTSDYTRKALSELQSYIATELPNTRSNRKLLKKLQEENGTASKDFGSRSVGDGIQAAEIIQECKQALIEANRARSEYQNLVKECKDTLAKLQGQTNCQ